MKDSSGCPFLIKKDNFLLAFAITLYYNYCAYSRDEIRQISCDAANYITFQEETP